MLPSLEHNELIFVQIAQIQLLSLFYDIWMLSDHQPSNVCKEEASFSVVRVCVGFRKLVMDAVVSHPFKDVVLRGNAIE